MGFPATPRAAPRSGRRASLPRAGSRQSCEFLTSDQSVVKRKFAVADDLHTLVTLARKYDDVATAGGRERGGNGGAPVGFDDEHLGPLHASDHLVDDRHRVFVPRV